MLPSGMLKLRCLDLCTGGNNRQVPRAAERCCSQTQWDPHHPTWTIDSYIFGLTLMRHYQERSTRHGWTSAQVATVDKYQGQQNGPVPSECIGTHITPYERMTTALLNLVSCSIIPCEQDCSHGEAWISAQVATVDKYQGQQNAIVPSGCTGTHITSSKQTILPLAPEFHVVSSRMFNLRCLYSCTGGNSRTVPRAAECLHPAVPCQDESNGAHITPYENVTATLLNSVMCVTIRNAQIEMPGSLRRWQQWTSTKGSRTTTSCCPW